MSSPRQDISELLRRRNIAIPKDQQKLLDRPDSWAIHYKDQPHGSLHVPGHVLETAKQAYLARQPPTQTNSQERPSSSSDESPVKSVDNHLQENGVPASQNSIDSGPPPSSPEREFTWTPSPNRQSHQPVAAVGSSIVKETPTTKPMAPPPRPAPQFSFPSSAPDDDEEEDELEMEVPQPDTKRDAPVNRTAEHSQSTLDSPIACKMSAMNTPPCAQPTQPVIPNTAVPQPLVPERSTTEIRRPRRMKEIRFDDGTPRRNQPTVHRMAPTKTFSEIGSSNSTSSSVIPATYDEPQPQHQIIKSIEEDSEDQDSTDPTNSITAMEVDHDEAESSPQTQARAAQVEGKGKESRAPQKPTRSSPPVMKKTEISLDGKDDPYQTFTQVYPGYTTKYSGTLWDFMKACVCLDWLRQRRMLRECLYDDFIRAFTGYQNYARNAGPGREPLPAVEWYNNLPGEAIFSRMVVTGQNLGYILDYYPKEIANAKRLIIDKSDEEEVIHQQSSSPSQKQQTPAKSPKQNDKLNGAMDIDDSTTSASQPRAPMTQLPPPPSPQLGSSIGTPSLGDLTPSLRKIQNPRTSQYLKRLSSGRVCKATTQKTPVEDRARLMEHFVNRRKSKDTRSGTSSRFGD